MPPIIVHQDKENSQDLQYTIPLEWIVHHTLSGYMDRYVWLKDTNQFFNVCGAYPSNKHILLFDGHGSHLDNDALRQIMWKNTQPFAVKSGNPTNYQPNDNGPNSKLKSLYNMAKSKWLMEYGMTKFSPHHMNSFLVEAWDTFKMSAENIINDSYEKTMLLPLSLTDLTTNKQACDAYIQVSSEAKSE